MKRMRFRLASITLIVLASVGVFPGVAEAIKPANSSMATTIVSAEYNRQADSIAVFGLASGKVSGIELAVRRSDGWFWDPIAGDWKPEEVWSKSFPTPAGLIFFVWDENLIAPPSDGDSILLLARAVSRSGQRDPKPAGMWIRVDNVKPLVKKFDIDGNSWSGSRDVTLSIEASGADYLQIAESRRDLKKAKKISYSEKVGFRLSKGDGQKTIYGAFRDGGGNRVVAVLSRGHIDLDTAPPNIKFFSPAAKAKTVSIGAKISVGFIDGTDIDPSTLRSEPGSDATFYLTQGSRLTSTTVAYDPEKKTAVLTPVEPLKKGKTYTAHLKTGIKDLVGNNLEDEVSWSFQAVEPSPAETKIDSMLEGVSKKTSVIIRGIAYDPDGVGAVSVRVRNKDGQYWNSISDTWTTEPFVNDALLVRKGKKQTGWHWRWRLPKADGERFVLTAAAKDRSLAEDPTPSGLSLLVDNQPPRIERLILQNDHEVTASDTITISSLVSGATEMRFGASPVEIKSNKWQPFATETSFALSKKEGQKEVFGQWRDALGNCSRIGEAGSKGSIILDKSGPKVSSTFPHDRANDVNVSVMVTANFNEISLDESWITTETFRLFSADGKEVPATVTFDRLSKSAALTPLEFLRYGEKYRAELSDKIKDRLGNSIENAFDWTFRTIGLSTHPPDYPRSLTVVSTQRGDKLSWKPPAHPDKGRDFNPPVQGGYNIYRATSAEGPFELINRPPVSTLTYTDNDYVRPERRFYIVKAVDAGGSESKESAIIANDDIDTRLKISPGPAATVTPANDLLRFGLPKLKKPMTIHITTKEAIGAPASPLRLFQLDSSPTIKIRKLFLTLPGDPDGAIVMKEEDGGWQPLANATYVRDQTTNSIMVGPVSSSGRYIVVNRTDETPPPALQPKISFQEGKPLIAWSSVNDPESGIGAYRLWRSETTTIETSTSTSVVSLPFNANRFLDTGAVPGQQYYYGVTAINGADLSGPIAMTDPTTAPRPMIDHRPRVAGVTNCRSCHIEKRVQNNLELIDCRLCHDGTGSSIVITGYDGGNSLCKSCHSLTRKQLNRAGSVKGECGGCHSKGNSSIIADGNGHTGHNGLNSIPCSSCHSLHRPGDTKSSYLVDPANARSSWKGSKSDFCLACHRRTGWPKAAELLDKFVSVDIIFSSLPGSRLFAGWSKTGWKKASHRKTADCLTCHAPHKSPNARLVAYRTKGGKYMYFAGDRASEDLCYECHRPGGPRGAADLLTLSRSFSTHFSGGAGIHDDAETAAQLGNANRHVNCNDCHNVHELQRQPRQLFSNKVSGALKGVPGVEPLNGGAGTIPIFTEVYAADREYQICLKCHSSYVGEPPAGMTDYALEFNPANPSYHPVEARGKNRRIKASAFVDAWSWKGTMYCSDCHAYPEESGTARGPHGSKYKPMLADDFGRQASPGHEDDLCYKCHNKKTYFEGQKGSRFQNRGGHADHIAKNKVACYQCHETHGSAFTEHLIKIVQPAEASGTVGFSHDATGGGCVSTCHAGPNEIYLYKHAY